MSANAQLALNTDPAVTAASRVTSVNVLPSLLWYSVFCPTLVTIEIGPPVVVVVGRAGAHAVRRMGEAGCRRDILERSVAAVPVQTVTGPLSAGGIGQ
jgi:hypothetical protein